MVTFSGFLLGLTAKKPKNSLFFRVNIDLLPGKIHPIFPQRENVTAPERQTPQGHSYGLSRLIGSNHVIISAY
jgi:hypothetical protein